MKKFPLGPLVTIGFGIALALACAIQFVGNLQELEAEIPLASIPPIDAPLIHPYGIEDGRYTVSDNVFKNVPSQNMSVIVPIPDGEIIRIQNIHSKYPLNCPRSRVVVFPDDFGMTLKDDGKGKLKWVEQ